jgi:hypothetical protein
VPIFSAVKIPVGTKLAAHGFYLLGLSNSGLVVPAKKGETTLYVRNTTGMSVGDAVEISTGTAKETRKIASISVPEALATPSQFGGGRPMESGPTIVWQPLPDGPVITIPKGSANLPVTSVNGFKVGQKMAIGYGATYPAVAQAIEKYEVVTVTQVGKPGTQAYLSANAKAGETNIKVSAVANISVGDKIRLDIDSKGHGIESVTVKSVGTQSTRRPGNGPITNVDEQGTGLELVESLKFDHSANIPFSVRGTGISFEPATAFAHSSNEPVMPLGTSITLDQPLTGDYAIDAVVLDQKVTKAGYQGTPTPNQLFGGPALSSAAGNMVLRDAAGNVVDGLNYGLIVDPWAAEGYQANFGGGASGSYAPSPGIGRGFRGGASASATQPNRSTGRYPDGADSDNNLRDFFVQSSMSLLISAPAGSTNIKVASITGFSVGQKIIIEAGAKSETAVIKTIGTTGGTTVGTATTVGAVVIPVANVAGFAAGQTINIDSGTNQETAVIASVAFPARGNAGGAPSSATITITTPLNMAHAVGLQVSGTGITLTAPLSRAHDNGAQVANYLPTPGAPNEYTKRP